MAQSAEGLQALLSHGSGDSNATDDDGGSGGYPSQDMHKKVDVEGSVDDSSDSSRSLIDARMAQRNAKIRKRKMKRRGLDDSEEAESEEYFGRNPYRMLSMPEKYTPPRKKSKQYVPDSDKSSPSENGNYEDDESGDDGDVALYTPKRIYQTDW
jgi:hypothetical protein